MEGGREGGREAYLSESFCSQCLVKEEGGGSLSGCCLVDRVVLFDYCST